MSYSNDLKEAAKFLLIDGYSIRPKDAERIGIWLAQLSGRMIDIELELSREGKR